MSAFYYFLNLRKKELEIVNSFKNKIYKFIHKYKRLLRQKRRKRSLTEGKLSISPLNRHCAKSMLVVGLIVYISRIMSKFIRQYFSFSIRQILQVNLFFVVFLPLNNFLFFLKAKRFRQVIQIIFQKLYCLKYVELQE